MFCIRTSCVTLGIFALWLIAPGLVASAQAAGVPNQATPVSREPGLLSQFAQKVITQLTTAKPNPTLTVTPGSTNPVTGQLVSLSTTWSQPVNNAFYTFDWGDGSGQPIQGPDSQQDHVYTRAGNFVASVRRPRPSTASQCLVRTAP